MMTHDEMIAVIAHHRDGGEIQCNPTVSGKTIGAWIAESHLETSGFNFSEFDYRPKPEPMVIYAEVSNLTGKVMRASTDSLMHQYDNTTIKKFIECND